LASSGLQSYPAKKIVGTEIIDFNVFNYFYNKHWNDTKKGKIIAEQTDVIPEKVKVIEGECPDGYTKESEDYILIAQRESYAYIDKCHYIGKVTGMLFAVIGNIETEFQPSLFPSIAYGSFGYITAYLSCYLYNVPTMYEIPNEGPEINIFAISYDCTRDDFIF
jgi:hypothetical protein